MALHMVDDPQDQNESDYNDNTGGGGRNTGGGGLLSFLPILLSLFGGGGKGKGIIVLLLLAAGAYFFFGRGNCNSASAINSLFSQSGYSYNPEEFKKASVYEGLEDNNAKNPLPERVSLAAYAPQRMNQGKQGSCVAWSSAYAARTILQSASTRTNPNQIAYSPSFLYNYIALEDCQGSYIQRAMEFMQKNGAVSYQSFPYDENDCSRQASNNLAQEAQSGKIHGFTRLTESDGVNGLNIRAIKEHLAKDAPVVIGMMVGGSFMEGMMGQKIWHPTAQDRQQMGFGGHAMCVIGYDDRLEGGAFEIMNSWGPEWGQNGIGFVRYADFVEFTREAYGIDPLPKQGAALTVPFEAQVGLVNNDNKQYIALKPAGENIYRTVSPVKKGTRFKMEINNKSECYIYIFTPDVNGKSFTLFPYKPIHSAYCGITGYRLFPRKESIMADSIGNKEVMAIVVSKQELNYTDINNAINQSTQSSYAAKINEVFNGKTLTNTVFSAGKNNGVKFSAPATNNGIITSIVEIDKQ
ncbi:MAG TPA: C1 family peptidase [Ferruginibacter sp.]|nr:C1 family peptidase [Ferruginibacter sp.]HRE63551.1 C1 family peptidase [Ferruginibacter sp.]